MLKALRFKVQGSGFRVLGSGFWVFYLSYLVFPNSINPPSLRCGRAGKLTLTRVKFKYKFKPAEGGFKRLSRLIRIKPPSYILSTNQRINQSTLLRTSKCHQPAFASLRQGRQINESTPRSAKSPDFEDTVQCSGLLAFLTSYFQIPSSSSNSNSNSKAKIVYC